MDLLSEVGSFSLYENPRQLIKLAGLTLRENSSGQHKGQKHISKRGRKKLKDIFYFKVIVPLIRHNEAFKKLHEYYTTRTTKSPYVESNRWLCFVEITEGITWNLQKESPF